MTVRGTVLIDRDGTMGGDHTLEYPQEYAPFPGTAEAIALLRREGYRVLVVTNQACIARGKDLGYDFAAEFRAIGADDWFLCPHDTPDGCSCRKPAPGLLLQAQRKYGFDMTQAFMVGDRWSDMAAGGAVGARLVLVLTGRGRDALGADREKWVGYAPDYVADDLLDAARWITGTVPESGRPE